MLFFGRSLTIVEMRRVILCAGLLACARLEVAEDTAAFMQRPPASMSSITIEGTAPPASAPTQTLPTQCREASEPPKKTAEAKQRYNEAQEQYDLGEYERAAQLFLRAYESYPHHAILFNAAQSLRQAGRYPEAIAYYQQFLCEETNEERRDTAKRYILELETRLQPSPPPPG